MLVYLKRKNLPSEKLLIRLQRDFKHLTKFTPQNIVNDLELNRLKSLIRELPGYITFLKSIEKEAENIKIKKRNILCRRIS